MKRKYKIISFFRNTYNLDIDITDFDNLTYKPSLNGIFRIKYINKKFILLCPGINNYYNNFFELFDLLIWFVLNRLFLKRILSFVNTETVIIGSIYNFYEEPYLLNFTENYLIFVQHGGVYGEYKHNILEQSEAEIADTFLYWNEFCETGIYQTRFGFIHKLHYYIISLKKIFSFKKTQRFIYSDYPVDPKLVNEPSVEERMSPRSISNEDTHHFHKNFISDDHYLELKNKYYGNTIKYLSKGNYIVFDGPGHTIYYYTRYVGLDIKIYYNEKFRKYLKNDYLDNFELVDNYLQPKNNEKKSLSLYEWIMNEVYS